MRRQFWRILGLAVLALAAASLAIIAWAVIDFRGPGPLTAGKTVIVPPGARIDAIARQLGDAGVVSHPLIFVAAAEVTGAAPRLHAGEYAFPAAVSARVVVDMMLA